ncbi:hypothetical protein HMI56_004274 [Coelomomyces lativittatus]|nr:hypothetical protein HMI56_004274 [Coelomomyces lativittatus]
MNQFQVVQEIHTKYAHKPNLPLVHSRKETSESDSDSSGTDSENEEEDESSSNIESDTSSTLLMDVDESQMQQEHFVHTERPKKQSIDDDGFILVQKNGKHYQPRSLDDP